MVNDLQSEALLVQYAALRRKFVDGLKTRLEEMESTTDAHALHANLHRLAGAAGAYGYAHIGDLARKAMHAVQQEAKGSDAQLALEALKAAMRELLQAQ
jgi:hypothetical protein